MENESDLSPVSGCYHRNDLSWLLAEIMLRCCRIDFGFLVVMTVMPSHNLLYKPHFGPIFVNAEDSVSFF